MLIRYKKIFEKIAMGLLSFMPEEKDLKKLQQTVKQYETDENWHLFLWKANEDFIGLIGFVQTDENTLVIQHITVNPSHRGQGIGKKMVQSIQEMFPDKQFKPTETIASFFQHCKNTEGSA